MKKFIFIFLLSCLFLYCNKSDKPVIETKINAPSEKLFKNIRLKKTFSTELIGGGFCIPFSKGYLVYEVLGKQVIKHYDTNGECKRTAQINSGGGPNDILSITEYFVRNDKLMFIDNNTYLKMLDPLKLNVTTIVKLSNKIENYYTKFLFSSQSRTDIEYFNGSTITSFADKSFQNNNFYLVSYGDKFENFRVLHKINRPLKSLKKTRKAPNESIHDYFNLTVFPRNFAVDWKNNDIYFIHYYNKPEIFRIDRNGKGLTKINLGIDSSDFIVDKDKVSVWYRWAVADTPNMFKRNKKHIYMYPKTAPVLRDVDIIGEWLLVTCGKRDWNTFENLVFVYRLPDLKFLGRVYFPTGDWPSRIFGKTLVTKRIIEKEDDFVYKIDCYQIEVL